MFEPSDKEPEVIIAEPAVPEKEIIILDTNSLSLDSGPKLMIIHWTEREIPSESARRICPKTVK